MEHQHRWFTLLINALYIWAFYTWKYERSSKSVYKMCFLQGISSLSVFSFSKRFLFCLQVMQLSGIEGEQAVLILEDHQVDASYLELINSLMSAGEVPGLYTPEELEPLLGSLRDQASQDGFRGTLVAYFASRVRRNLHIVLIMDSLSNDFTANCESNPAFYKNCAFQWMQGWSKDSMTQSKGYRTLKSNAVKFSFFLVLIFVVVFFPSIEARFLFVCCFFFPCPLRVFNETAIFCSLT